MKVFPLSLANDAKEWWISEEITTWEELVKKFFCRFYPESYDGENEMLDEGDNGNSFKPVAQTTTNADGTSTSLIPGLVTTEEKAQKKNDVKARSMLLMALPNEHLMTFNQYKDAKTLFAAIQTRFGGNEATKKTQKTLLKQMYENFSAPSTESLDSIFNRLQKIVSQLAILGENISQEDLNLKFLRSLPSEWNTHVVVWRNKPDLDTMSFDDLYNNFKIVEQEVKGTASSSSSSSSQNMAFVSSPSSTNEVNTAYGVSTANTQVSPASTQVSTASTQVSTANLSDDTVYAFLASQPNGSQLVYEELKQIHEDDIEEMDLKWQLALLSIRTRRFFQKTDRKITINGSDTAVYDKSKVECFTCHKMGYFARECRGPRNQDSRNRNQDSSRRTINVEETSSKAMVAIDGAGFDWSYMADDEVPTNMALMAFSDSEVHNDKTCSKTCLKSFETLKTQLDELRIEFNKSEFNLATYKRGLASVEEQLVFYKKNEVIFCEQLVVLKRDISYKDSELSMLKSELEKLKQEKESNQLKIEKFDNASKSLDKLIGSQITDKNRKSVGFVSYNVVLPPPTGLFSPPKFDLSNSCLEESQQPEFQSYGPQTSKSVSKDISNEVRESHDAPSVEELVSDDKSQTPRGNQRNLNNQNSQQLGSDFVMYNKTCFVCGSFDHVQADYNYHQRERVVSGNNYTRVNYNYSAKKAHPSAHRIMVPRLVLMKTGLRSLNTARTINTGHPRKEDQCYVDSGCSRHMTGNMLYLSDFKEFDGGYVTFGGRSQRIRNTADSKLPTTFWGLRQYNTACYDQNRFISSKPQQEPPYELFRGDGLKWLFDIDVLTKSMNYVSVVAGTNSINFVDTKESIGAGHSSEETGSSQDYILMPLWKDGSPFDSSSKDASNDEPQPSNDAGKKDDEGGINDQEKPEDSSPDVNTTGSNINTASINTGSLNISTVSPTVLTALLESELDLSNICYHINLLLLPNTRIHKDHPLIISMIGSLMYLTASSPNKMFAVCALNQRFKVTPKDSPFDLEAYTDSDYAGASLDRKSTTGGCQFLGRRLILWQCKKQTIVANSTTEAEYVAAASCCGQVLWIQNQMLDYGYNFMNTKIQIDNESTICIVKNPVFHSKTKHIEIRHHFIRDSNEKKLIQMINIHIDHNVADLLIKAFDVGRFQYLIASIGMLNH
ncbi:ribonuclease H-like domain-containing protein [Tanacetum coccineum]